MASKNARNDRRFKRAKELGVSVATKEDCQALVGKNVNEIAVREGLRLAIRKIDGVDQPKEKAGYDRISVETQDNIIVKVAASVGGTHSLHTMQAN